MVKVISLSNEAYGKLRALKGNRSFSEIVVEITANRKKGNIMDFAGVLKDNADEWERIKERIYEDRKKFKLRAYKL